MLISQSKMGAVAVELKNQCFRFAYKSVIRETICGISLEALSEYRQ